MTWHEGLVREIIGPQVSTLIEVPGLQDEICLAVQDLWSLVLRDAGRLLPPQSIASVAKETCRGGERGRSNLARQIEFDSLVAPNIRPSLLFFDTNRGLDESFKSF